MRILVLMFRLLAALVLGTSAALSAATPIRNTATLTYQIGTSNLTLPSNTTELTPALPPTPATVQFLRLAPEAAAASLVPIDGGQCTAANGSKRALASVPSINQVVINPLAAPVVATSVFHASEPVVISLTDLNRNADPLVRETVDVILTSTTGDVERLTLKETAADSGIFTALVETAAAPRAVVPGNCQISVAQGAVLTVSYTDAFYPTDIAQATVLVDPFGIVFNAQTGEPVNRTRVTIVVAATGLPATVFGDDGVSAYPASVITGDTIADASGRSYTFPPGGFRFPFLAPGLYRLVIESPVEFVVPSSADRAALALLRDPDGNPFSIITGSFGEAFEVTGPEAIKIDIPADPLPGSIALQKSASVSEASVGDFIQYRLTLENRSPSVATGPVTITDVLPAGFRYRAGSTRAGSLRSADPGISADGRTLTFAAPSVPAGTQVQLTYITQVVRDFEQVEAVNRAVARSGRADTSNEARVAVQLLRDVATSRFTLIGQVTVGACNIARQNRAGAPNIRLFLDDGTSVTTDSDGRYHFEGVRPGTHVVQLDIDSIPADMEIIRCGTGTRWAGRSFSQFVEARGGTLWRADFTLQKRAVPVPRLTLSAATVQTGSQNVLTYTISQSLPRPVTNARLFVNLPKHLALSTASIAGASLVTDANDTGMGLVTLAVPTLAPGATQTVTFAVSPSGTPCLDSPVQAFLLFDADIRKSLRAPTVQLRLPCPGQAKPDPANSGDIASSSVDVPELARHTDKLASAILDDATAAGATTDWLADASPGEAFLFPTAGHNPRAPVVRVVFKHRPVQRILLQVNGTDVSPISFDGTTEAPGAGVAVSAWRGVPIAEGDNVLEAIVQDAAGAEISRHRQTVHFANAAAHAQLVPDLSHLVADELTQSVLAVRFTDRFGKPVRAGVGGELTINAPYLLAQGVDDKQLRQLTGEAGGKQTYVVEGDDGIARIALQPTSASGSVQLSFAFNNERSRTVEDVRAWLAPKNRDWIIVGFAKGTLAHTRLAGKAENLPDTRPGTIVDGQTSFYAKGRIRGNWLLTLAYDSDKPRGRTARDRELLRVIDPNKYYTLYGDQTQQTYDAPSLERIYVRLETRQFYALFGDYQTGLNQTKLSRYDRSFNGLKAEYRGERNSAVAFASKTQFNFARDELQGNGLATFYRLTRSQIILNSEKITLETRDRLRSDRIVTSQALTRHIDYDIDYSAGTLTFRSPVRSRDSDFNPQFIVVNYETFGTAGTFTNAGGRVGQSFASGRIEIGASALYDESVQGQAKLGGFDFKAQLTPDTLLRAEIARTATSSAASRASGNAYLVELEHRTQSADVLAYIRQQDTGFGLGQQNRGESGARKYGVDGRVRLGAAWQVSGTAYRENYFTSQTNRTVAQSRLEHVMPNSSYFVGGQFASDAVVAQPTLQSTQLSAGFNQFLFNRKLELTGQSDISVGGSADNIDFPDRYRAGAAYTLRDGIRIIGAYELSRGKLYDSGTAQIGFDIRPWRGGKLSTTLNQARIAEYGPRTYGLFGIAQSLSLGSHWSVDAGGETSRSFNQKSASLRPINQSQPLASGGTLGDARSGASVVEDFWALSAGATYRNEAWTWNGRVEHRAGEVADRTSLSTAFIRQTQRGVAVSGYGQYLNTASALGASGTRATLGVAVAYRPLGSSWSVLDKLELRTDTIVSPAGKSGTGALNLTPLFADSLSSVGTGSTRRIVNNLAINYFGEGAHGPDDVWQERAQLSLTYTSKYVLDQFDGLSASGYTDMIGLELRKDLNQRIDIGLQASLRTIWTQGSRSFSFGPQIGVSPFENAWISLGYNIDGFRDRDFQDARATAKGPYITFRLKFDQLTAQRILGR